MSNEEAKKLSPDGQKDLPKSQVEKKDADFDDEESIDDFIRKHLNESSKEGSNEKSKIQESDGK